MVAFVIFWSATFSIIFFVLGIFFKALASAFKALLTSIGKVLLIVGLALVAGIALYLLYVIIDGIINEGFWSVLGSIIMLFVVFGILGALMGDLGTISFELVFMAVSFVLEKTFCILEWLAMTCEKGYAKFLMAIIKRLDKC